MQRRWDCISVLVLVLFGFLLGNDSLMAVNSHAQQDPAVHAHAAEVPIVTTCPMPDDGRATSSVLPLPDVVHVALVPGPLPLPVIECRSIGWAMPPDTPPDVRRAFLQVFLN